MKIKTLIIAGALLTAAITPAFSGASPALPTTPAAPQPGPGAGPWIVGGTIVSAISLMICAEWECAISHREMSSQEAILAATIPFSCFWYRRTHTDHGPTCSGPPKP